MTTAPGTRLGPYEIISSVGAGGMGEVYKARDTRLDRIVAIKVLAAHLASNQDVRERFDREARVVSSLNHPNICVLHDVGHDRGIDFLVMEYLEGETLAERLERGPLPLDEVLRSATQIADALDRAHRQGVVHRDLKPGNVMLTKTGVKLLDFGLAKLAASTPPAGGAFAPSMPTAEHALTAQGTILGTFQYMAPEQLEGGEADARTDMFAFGVLVYEMATGRKAFEGKTHASLIGAILKDQPPPISTVQTLSPPALDDLVARCLAKDPDDRWQSAHDIASQLRWIQQSSGQAAVTPARGRSAGRERVAWALAILAILAAGALAIRYSRREAADPVVRFTIGETENASFTGAPMAPFPIVSPDGRHIAFLASPRVSAPTMLFVRTLDTVEPRAIAGTEGAALPFWSADSRALGFFISGAIKRVDISSGLIQTICATPGFEGATWNQDGVVLFSKGGGGLFRVDAGGGEPVAATTLDATSGAASHRWPVFLPDGRHFLFLTLPGNDLYYGSLDGATPKRVLRSHSKAAYSAGHVLYGIDGALFAQQFDRGSGDVTGEPIPLAQDVRMNSASGRAAYSVSDNGVLVYREGILGAVGDVVWMDKSGKQLETVLEDGDYRGIALSPDGRRLAFHRHEAAGGGTLWVKDLSRGTITRLTPHPSHNVWPEWVPPDGERIAFLSDRQGMNDIYVKSASGTGEDDLVYRAEGGVSAMSWSAGPEPLVAFSVGGVPAAPGNPSNADLWILRPGATPKAEPFLQTQFAEFQPAVSPDGKWIAYASNESSRGEVFVQPYPPDGRKYPISTAGGTQPRWTRNGRELVYIGPESRIMAVTITVTPAFDAGVPRQLFQSRLRLGQLGAYRPYDVSHDGEKFLVHTLREPDATGATEPLTVVLNWPASLPRR